MSYDELFRIARQRGFVYWTRSGKVEQVRVAKKGGKILATRVTLHGPQDHYIAKHPNPYLCTRIDPQQALPVGALIWP